MSFGEDCPLDFLLQLQLPEIKIIELHNINLVQTKFDVSVMMIVRWATRNMGEKETQIRYLDDDYVLT